MEEYKSNSNKSRENRRESTSEKKVEKIITGSVRAKKKNGIEKFAKVFLPEDVQDVKSYILIDVLVPMIKDAALDIIKTLFYGEAGRGKRGSAASKVSYRSYYEKENDRRRDYGYSVIDNPGYNYDDIILDSRGEAEDVLSRMDELIVTYGLVSVADLYDLVGILGKYTDNKYGWTDIRNASVVRAREGYLIKLPKALPLN